MKKLISITLLLALVLLMVSCKPAETVSNPGDLENNNETQEGDKSGSEIALVIDVGTIDDKSFNQGAWEGIKKFAEETGKTYNYYKSGENSTDAFVSAMELAVKGGAKVLVTPGFLFEEAVYKAQDIYPDIKFVLIDGVPHNADYTDFKTGENTVSVSYSEEQAGYLAGYAAVKEGYKKLGFMGGQATPPVVNYGYGYIQGADAAAKEFGITDVEINYYYTGVFSATPEIQSLSATWYKNGTEVIFSCGGSIISSVTAAAEATTPQSKVIGVDVDQSGESDTIITSAMKSMTVSVYDLLTKIYDNNFPGGENQVLGAKDSGVALPMETSKFEKFTQEDYDTIFGKLSDGSIKPLKNADENGNPITISDIPVTNVKINEIQ